MAPANGPMRARGRTQPLYNLPGLVNSPSIVFQVDPGCSRIPFSRFVSMSVGMASPDWSTCGPKIAD